MITDTPHLSFDLPLVPRLTTRRKSERDRLLAALAVTDPARWPLTWQHMADKLVEHAAGRLPTLF